MNLYCKMAEINLFHLIIMSFGILVSCSGQNQGELGPNMRRQFRDVNGPSDHDTQTTNIERTLASLEHIMGFNSIHEMESHVGDISDYVSDKLNEISVILEEIGTQSDLTDEQKLQVTSLVQSVSNLGYLLGLKMRRGESRRVSINKITLFVDVFYETRFQGLHFSQDDGAASIVIPITTSFPSRDDDVISISYSVSGINKVLPASKQNNESLVGSDVISTVFVDSSGVKVDPVLAEPLLVVLRLDEVYDGQPVCSFLQEDESDSIWSDTGCNTIYPVKGEGWDTVHCYCDHLTVFSVIVAGKDGLTPLGFATWFGCGITIFCCVLTALVFIGYRLVQTVRGYIRVSFITALGLAEIFFLCIDYIEAPGMCTVIALGVHFFASSSFTWLLSYALYLGNELSGDMEASLHVVHYTFLGWAFPFITVLITFIWRYNSYIQEDYCWIADSNGLRYAYMVPISIYIVLTVGVIMYDIAVFVTIKDPKREFAMQLARSGLRSCCGLLPVLSAVWIIADFLVNMRFLWLQIVFTILNAVLGIMLFLIMFYFNEEVRTKRSMVKKRRNFMYKAIFEREQSRSRSSSRDRQIEMNVIFGGFHKRPPPSPKTQVDEPREVPTLALPFASQTVPLASQETLDCSMDSLPKVDSPKPSTSRTDYRHEDIPERGDSRAALLPSKQ